MSFDEEDRAMSPDVEDRMDELKLYDEGMLVDEESSPVPAKKHSKKEQTSASVI